MRYFHVLFLVVLVVPLLANAEEGKGNDDEAKMISGMSVLGNKDAPKSLYIVPWKSSEIGVETDLTSSLLDEEMVPVDKPVFMRELDFYQVSTEK
ncbi:MAG: hypothetical protein P1U59_03205 [Alcanivorax sp.]|jgi:hypothetical protein|uniref:hypothetical protein n=1 Tax=Alcanivorax sp. TaxID=1872427 RepID=UPI00260A39E8|nr:hypothetical protein [Alcanivorax sp.]MDF1723497.1 hypothetical protein [Alcanivorax sp.]